MINVKNIRTDVVSMVEKRYGRTKAQKKKQYQEWKNKKGFKDRVIKE